MQVSVPVVENHNSNGYPENIFILEHLLVQPTFDIRVVYSVGFSKFGAKNQSGSGLMNVLIIV